MHAHAPAAARKIERNDTAEPPGRAGHQHGPGFFVSGHGWLREGAANRFRRGEFALRGHSRRASETEQGFNHSRRRGGREQTQPNETMTDESSPELWSIA